LSEKDIVRVMVPNVIRGADDFISGAADMFFFAFGAPKVREVDATVGGIRALEIPASGNGRNEEDNAAGLFDAGRTAGRSSSAWRSRWASIPTTTCCSERQGEDEVVYKVIETLVANKADLVAIPAGAARILRRALYK